MKQVYGIVRAQAQIEKNNKGVTMLPQWFHAKIASMRKNISSRYREPDRLFMVGDRVLYPNHGRGKIMGLITLPTYGDFYSIKMDMRDLKILVPMDKMGKVGVVYLKPKE